MGNLLSCTTQKVNNIYKPVSIEELQNIKEPITEDELKIEETIIEENIDEINEQIFTETRVNEEDIEYLEEINKPVVVEKPIPIEDRM